MNNWVYIISNDFPIYKGETIYKIGRTTKNYQERINNLYNTSVPLPFEKVMVINTGTEHCANYERELHNEYYESRISEEREFFRLHPEDIFEIYSDVINNPNYNIEYISLEYLCKYYEKVVNSYEEWICDALCIDYDDEFINRARITTPDLVDLCDEIELRCARNGEGTLLAPEGMDFKEYIIRCYGHFVYDDEKAREYLEGINRQRNREE